MATMTLDQLQVLVEQQGAQLSALQAAAAAETPLPTEYYTLSQTGEAVDNAIRRAMAGGAIDIALADKAPSGYGLGTSAPQFADNDANNVTGSGWNSVNSTTANRPTGVTWGCIRTDYYYSGAIWQTYYQMGSTCRAVRYFSNGAWSGWEWDNPPLAAGVEYRTVERWNRDPVYAMSVQYKFTQTYTDSFSLEIPHGIENFGNLIKAEIVQPPYSYPYVDSRGGMAGVKYVNATNIVFDSYKVGFRTGNILNFVLHYTKTA